MRTSLRVVCQTEQASTPQGGGAITCLAVAGGGEQVYAGTSTGHLVEYRLPPHHLPPPPGPRSNGNGSAPSSTVSLPSTPLPLQTAPSPTGAALAVDGFQLAACTALSKKPVEEICLLPAAHKLAVRCDGGVWLLDRDTLASTPLGAGVKGARRVVSDQSQGDGDYPARLCVVLRRRLAFFHVRAGSGGPGGLPVVPVMEIDIPVAVRTLVWHGQHLVVGTDQAYNHLELPPGAAQLGAGGAKKGSLSLSSPPWEEIVPISPGTQQLGPTLAALPRSAEVVLQLDGLGIITNMRGQPTSSSLAFASPPLLLAQSAPYVLAATADGAVEVYARDGGDAAAASACVQRLPLQLFPTAQLRVAADAEGRRLVVAVGTRLVALAAVGLEEQVRELLKARQLDAAVALAEAAVQFAGAPAEWPESARAEAAHLLIFDLEFERACALLRQCRRFQPGELFPFFPEATAPWLHLARPKRYWGLHPPPQALPGLIRDALRQKRSRQSSRAWAVGDTPSPAKVVLTSQQEADQVASVLGHAQRAFASFMAAQRARTDLEEAAAQREGVDALLLRLYTDTRQVAALEALAKSCACPPPRALKMAEALRAAGRHHAAALLSERCGAVDHAVAIWAALAKGNCAEAAPDASRGGGGSSGSSAIDQGGEGGGEGGGAREGEVAATEGGARAVGVREAARVLASSGDANLILTYMPMVLEAGPAVGLQVLTSTQRADPLPVERLLELLRERGAAAVTLRRQFLEHLVTVGGDTDAARHTELARCLLEEACAAGRDGAAATAAAAGPGSAPSEERARLRQFLSTSACYDVRAVLAAVEAAGVELWEEQAVLLGKLSDHGAALRILVGTLRSPASAEEYCRERDSHDETQAAYTELLHIYLSPPGGEPKMFKEALELLSSQHTIINPLQVLELLPEDMPVQLAMGPLQRLLCERTGARREAQMTRAMHAAKLKRVQAARVTARGQTVTMTTERVCGNCHVRLAGRADGQQVRFFAVYPNGSLACYQCYQQSGSHVCPVTLRDFRARPAAPEGEITLQVPT